MFTFPFMRSGRRLLTVAGERERLTLRIDHHIINEAKVQQEGFQVNLSPLRIE